MSSKQKRQVFILPAKKYLDVSVGPEYNHDQGCGKHDNRPKRLRTRETQTTSAIKEWQQ